MCRDPQPESRYLKLSEVAASHIELSAITYSDMPRGTDISDPTFEKAQRVLVVYLKQVNLIEGRIDKLFERKNLVERLIEPHDEIVRLRFFKKYKRAMVVRTVRYSRKQYENIFSNAIKEMMEV